VTRLSRVGAISTLAALLGAGCGGPAIDARALAAAAGTLYEAVPFVLLVFALERWAARHRCGSQRRWLPLLGLAGCGCSRGHLPGALALPAIALCALAFGPVVAGVRILLALGIVFWGRRTRPGPSHTQARPPLRFADPLATLESLAASAFVASLLVSGLAGIAVGVPWPLALVAGFAIGAIAPCATAGVAIAAAFAHVTPWAAAGILASTGLVCETVVHRFTNRHGSETTAAVADAPARTALFASIVLAIALATLALRGPSGLVNPRLLLPIGCASVAAFALRGSLRSRSAHPLLAPALMLAVAVAPPNPPVPQADVTRLDDAFAGERLAFTGQVARNAGRTILARYVITCCRIDATPIAVRLDRALAARDGMWLEASGTLVRDPTGALALHAERVRAIAVPSDPFTYR
jgi:hypothetical protein